jgi:hypothetical protein
MAELEHLIAFTIEKYTTRGGKSKRIINRLVSCQTMTELLKIRKRLGMMQWGNK